MVAVSNPQPGFSDPAGDAQTVFRAALDALSRPGRVVPTAVALPDLPPFEPAALALCLALTDLETPLWLDPLLERPEILSHLRFHTGCPLAAAPAEAAFAVIADAQVMPPLSAFNLGSDDYPDRAATLIVQVPALHGGQKVIARGPGIQNAVALSPAGLPSAFWSWVGDNHALFPRGVDLIFACGGEIMALPRSTRTET